MGIDVMGVDVMGVDVMGPVVRAPTPEEEARVAAALTPEQIVLLALHGYTLWIDARWLDIRRGEDTYAYTYTDNPTNWILTRMVGVYDVPASAERAIQLLIGCDA